MARHLLGLRRYIGIFSRVESVASMMMQAHFSGMDNMYEILDWVKELTLPGLEARLRKGLAGQR